MQKTAAQEPRPRIAIIPRPISETNLAGGPSLRAENMNSSKLESSGNFRPETICIGSVSSTFRQKRDAGRAAGYKQRKKTGWTRESRYPRPAGADSQMLQFHGREEPSRIPGVCLVGHFEIYPGPVVLSPVTPETFAYTRERRLPPGLPYFPLFFTPAAPRRKASRNFSQSSSRAFFYCGRARPAREGVKIFGNV